MLSATDVAREAGVSRATVSYVLNDRRDVRVSERTRERVLEVARRLGYSGSPAARALRTGRGGMVLLLLPDWDVGGQLAWLLERIGATLFDQGLMCVRFEGDRWRGELSQLLSRIPAACVVTLTPLGADDARTLAASGLPEVRAWLLDEPDAPHTTLIDQGDLVAAQVRHLADRGYARLGFVGISEPGVEPFVRARATAFPDACARLGLTGAPVALVDTRDGLMPVLAQWSEGGAPVGVAAFNDTTAVGVLSAASSLGLQVPDRIGVIGCDDTSVTRLTSPTLSSVRFDLAAEADAVTAQILDATSHPGITPSTCAGGVGAVSRASTALTCDAGARGRRLPDAERPATHGDAGAMATPSTNR